MPINWKTLESQERLLACIVASLEPEKPNIKKIAELFGQGLTPGALNWQFKPIRDAAKKITEEAKAGVATATTVRKAPAKKAAKSQASSKNKGVIGGRVEKKTHQPKNFKLLHPAVDDDEDIWSGSSGGVATDGIDSGRGIMVDDEEEVLESVEGDNIKTESY